MIYYLYGRDSREFVSKFRDLDITKDVEFVEFEIGSVFPAIDLGSSSHIVVSGNIEEIKLIFDLAHKNSISVGLVPLPTQSRLAKIYSLPITPMEALSLAMEPCEKSIDLLYCNDRLVVDDIRIGNTSAIKEFEFYYPKQSFLKRVKLFLSAIVKKGALRHHKFTIKTAKNDTHTISALGMIALGYNNFSPISKILKDKLSAIDGQHTLLILSPISLWQYFIASPVSLFIHRYRGDKTPSFWGYIKSSKMEISSSVPLKVVIDDHQTISTPIALETRCDSLRVSVGDGFWEEQNIPKGSKSSIKLTNMPKDSERIEYLSKGLPLFSHASTEQYATLFSNLRDEGSINATFVTLLMLATMIATFGLFINSSSVIIGAMLLAPLMQPIVSLSMGVLRQDVKLFKNSIITVALGISITLATAMVIAHLIPIRELTNEMSSRISPTLLDMFVAIVSGIAAAYAKNDEKISSSLAGVAIAVALVPPLAVSGIGLGWGEWSMFFQSLLLFTTNLIGIVLAGAITFMVLGYAPIKVAKRGIVAWSIIATLITIPLYHSFEAMRDRSNIQKNLSDLKFYIDEKPIYLSRVEYRKGISKDEVRCEVILNEKLTKTERDYLKKIISKVVGRPTNIIVTFRYQL
ncbi:putative integral membrane protein [hydrothermal vent metagenome]|uniref:Putative integral membrane protein n=1 Tax=hydrothermal vent metagenome TaxID=652676 RepID=A0A1W1BR85_9ZZZZ